MRAVNPPTVSIRLYQPDDRQVVIWCGRTGWPMLKNHSKDLIFAGIHAIVLAMNVTA